MSHISVFYNAELSEYTCVAVAIHINVLKNGVFFFKLSPAFLQTVVVFVITIVIYHNSLILLGLIQ